MPRRLVELSETPLTIKSFIWQYLNPWARKPNPRAQSSNMPRIPRGVNQESHYLFHYEQTFAEITSQQIDHWHFINVRDGNEVSSSFIPMRVSPPRVSFDFNVDTLVLKPPMLDPSRRYGREGFDKLRYVALYRVEFTGDLQQDHRWFATHLCWTQHNLIHLMYECFDKIRMICLIISDEDESWSPVMKEKYAKFGYRITKMQKHSFAATAAETMLVSAHTCRFPLIYAVLMIISSLQILQRHHR